MSQLQFELHGSHTGANNQLTVLTDATKTFTTLRVQIGDIVYNITDGSSGIITSVGTTTLTCSGGLTGGAQNDWDTNDLYRIWVTDPHLVRFTLTDVLYYPMMLEATIANGKNTAEPSFSDYQKVRLVDNGVTGHYLFYGKITKITPEYDTVYGQDLIIEAKDNLNELLNSIVNTNYSGDTYRGKADAPTGLINQIVVDHTRTGNITATGDTVRFETSAVAVLLTGTHTGPNNAVSLTDTTKNFVTLGVGVGSTLSNTTDGSSTTITSITTTTNPNDTLVGVLVGGGENLWDIGDTYTIAGALDTEFVNKGKNALRAIGDISVEDPWDATNSGFGYDYFLDTSYGASMNHIPVMHYFKRGTRPAGDPSIYGLKITYGATQSAQVKTMLPDYNFPRATNELVTKVRLEYARVSSGDPPTTIAQSIIAILINHGATPAPPPAFAIGEVITWNAAACSAIVESVGDTYLIISENPTDLGTWLQTISGLGITGVTSGATATVNTTNAAIPGSLREKIEQDIEVLVRDYTITDQAEARSRIAQILHQSDNTIERGEFSVIRWPHYWITGVSDAISATVLTDAPASFINNGIMPGDWITNTGVANSKNITGVITSRNATTITCSAGGMNWEVGDTYIVYLHIRAGQNIQVVNSNKSLDSPMIVTRIQYDEGPGIAFARIEVKNKSKGKRATIKTFESLGRNDEDNVVNVMRTASGTTRVEFSPEGIFGYNAGTAQFYLRSSDGKAYFAGGEAVIDENGITMDCDGSGIGGLYFTFKKGANTLGWLYANPTTGDLYFSTNSGYYLGLGQGGVTPIFIQDEGVHVVTETGKNIRLTAPSNNGATGYIVLDSKKTNAGNPGTPREGMIYINTADNEVRMYADGAWRTLAGPW